MEERKTRIVRSCLRTALAYFMFVIFSFLIRAFLHFGYNTFKEAEFASNVLDIIGFLMSLLSFFSLTRLFTLHDKSYFDCFFAGNEDRISFKRKIKFLFCSCEFWMGISTTYFLMVVLPANFGYLPLLYTLSYWWPIDLANAKIYVLLVMTPLMLFLHFAAFLSVFNSWIVNVQRLKKAKHKPNGKLVKEVCITALIYCSSAIVLPIVLPVLITFFNVLKKPVILVIFAACGIGLIIIRYIRAAVKRKNFLTQLCQTCKEKGYDLSQITAGYRSLVRSSKGSNFSVRIDETVYDCKIIQGMSKNTPMFLDDNGNYRVVRTFKILSLELFKFVNTFTYAFHSEGKKIIIINPIPSKIFINNSEKAKEFDVGETINEYKIYNSTAFLNALKRNVLDK